jgi:DNA invertase Pin-like site-specific DNA recombinase
MVSASIFFHYALFHVFGALAQFERSLIQERVNAGLAAAKKRGRIGGRPRAIPQ